MNLAPLQIGLLGPVVAERDGELFRLGGPKQRAVLAALALEPGRVVGVDAIIRAVWGEEPAEGALRTVQVYVANLRKTLESRGGVDGETSIILRREPGYVLSVDDASVDVSRFERAVRAGRELTRDARHHEAASVLRDALADWRGSALADLAGLPLHDMAGPRLDELRLDALEVCIEAELQLGLHSSLVTELEMLIEEAPYRERLHAQLMRALYGSGRQRDALRAYQGARRTLVDELGIEPGAELRTIEQQILAQDPSLDPVPEPIVVEVPRRDAAEVVRKQVSIVAATRRVDAIDHQLMERMATMALDHGATILEKNGSRIVAVLGAPRLGTDDAGAAVGLASKLGRLPDVAVGVATGRVTAGGAVVSGSAVGRAAALAASASSATVLIDAMTRDLAGARANCVKVGEAFEVESWTPAAHSDRVATTPFVGRAAELGLLRESLQLATRTQQAAVITLVGEPGVGLSRLAFEFANVERAVPVVIDCRVGDDDLCAQLTHMLDADDSTPDRLATEPDRLAQALRSAAADGLLLVVLESIDRATRSSLDALGDALRRTRNAPLVVVATASSAQATRAPAWVDSVPLSLTLEVGPLSLDDASRLASLLLGDDVVGSRARDLARASGGNPFFLEELVAFGGSTDREPPRRLSVLVSARIDALPAPARRVLEALAVVGGAATASALDALVADELDEGIDRLVGSGLVDVADDGSLRAHSLVADLALEAASSERAASLHTIAASRSTGAVRVAHLEAAAHHLLDADVSGAADAARDALDELACTAWRAWGRGDADTAVETFARAVRLANRTGDDAVELARRSRRRLAAGAVTGRLSSSPPLLRPALLTASWDPTHPAEVDLLRTAEACAVDRSASPPVVEASRVVIEALGRPSAGSAHGSSERTTS